MEVRALEFVEHAPATPIEAPGLEAAGWVWIDVQAGPEDLDALVALTAEVGLDTLALRDTVEDLDLPKVDDFGSSLLVVLHALAEGRVETYELDCLLTERHLVTVRGGRSPSVDALWDAVQERVELSAGGPDEMLARLADVVTRRLVSVLDVFDGRNEGLVELALRADPTFLGEITAVRADLSTLRRAVVPQREMLDALRRSPSSLLSDGGRRRFSDVFDAASRAAHGVEAARTGLAETLDAYRGAEAKQATEVTKVLTVYAAIMLPLSLIAGFFGMNFENLPLVGRESGWVLAAGMMGLVAIVSLGMFVALGWIRRPSGRSAGTLVGQGLAEAARTPAQLVGAVYEISTMPLRGAIGRRSGARRADDSGRP